MDIPTPQAEVTQSKKKPVVPTKHVKLIGEKNINRSTHVRDMIRKLQEKENRDESGKQKVVRCSPRRNVATEPTSTPDENKETTNRTIEDLKAIDADIEKLRKQIEERDKIIIALREAAEAKDKKLDKMMVELSQSQTSATKDARTSEQNLSTSPSPPLCNGELCWSDGFVNKNYHEPVYAQLLNDHTALQRIYNELQAKLEFKTKEMEDCDNHNNHNNHNSSPRTDSPNSGLNLIMAEQIRILEEREAKLISEAEELREQNDLMEFRILELEECRKEEILNSKQRNEKGVWSERDVEDVSDSGVMSLPTSEDMTSDSELGDTVRNYYSPETRITGIATVFPSNESCNDDAVKESGQKKLLRSAECLQESGIFEDSEISTDGTQSDFSSSECHCLAKQSKSCQTESILDKTILEIIDSSCNFFLTKNRGYLDGSCEVSCKSDDLTTEISKLSEIQKRIQQKRSTTVQDVDFAKSTSPVLTCPHSNSVVYYEERLAQLEDKLRIYESSGDAKDDLLVKRLEREIELAHRVKHLSDKVNSLERTNRHLEEEKCEFEEAENDSRFQCQSLEIRLQELIAKNAELEIELERRKNLMADDKRKVRRKNNLEGLVSKYEQRNLELEEREEEAKHRLRMMEAAMPAVLAWQMFRMCQTHDMTSSAAVQQFLNIPSNSTNEPPSDVAIFRKLEELIEDQTKLRREYERAEEEATRREKELKMKIEELEQKSARDRALMEEMTSNLKGGKPVTTEREKGSASLESVHTADLEIFEELKHLAENEVRMRRKIDELERKEQAYVQTLQQADEIWAGMEADYKKRLQDAESVGTELQQRVSQLEKSQSELEKELENHVKPEQRVSELEAELRNHTDEDAQGRMEELQEENRKLSETETELRQRLGELETALEENNRDRESHVKTIEELQEEKRKLSDAVQLLEGAMEKGSAARQQELQVRVGQLQADNQNLREQLAGEAEIKLINEIATLEKENDELRSEIARLKQELPVAQRKSEILEQELQVTRQQVNQERLVSKKLEDKNKNLSNVELTLNIQITDLTQELARKTKEIRSLEVTTGELREEVETLENRVTELTETLNSKPLLEKGTVTTTVEDGERTPVDNQPFVNPQPLNEEFPLELVQAVETEIEIKTESNVFSYATVEQLIPTKVPQIIEVILPSLTTGPVVDVQVPSQSVSPKYTSLEGVAVSPMLDSNDEEALNRSLVPYPLTEDEELTKISLENTQLLNKLEKVEEESKLKDQELEKLQKTVTELRKEQEELGTLLGIDAKLIKITIEKRTSAGRCEGDTQPDRWKLKQCEDVPRPCDEKWRRKERKEGPPADREPCEKMPPTLSNLQVALDNLQNKCRVKNVMIKALLDELKQKGNQCAFDELLAQMSCDFPPDSPMLDFDRTKVYEYLKGTHPVPMSQKPRAPCLQSRSVTKSVKKAENPLPCPPRSAPCQSNYQVAPLYSSVSIPLVGMRQVGYDSLLVEWDVSDQPPSVVGYEICVNGDVHHRVRCPTRDKALLHSLDLSEKIVVSLYAVSSQGRSSKCTTVIFPDEKCGKKWDI